MSEKSGTEGASARTIEQRFSFLFLVATPVIAILAFLPAALPQGFSVLMNSAMRIIALSALCAVSILARTQYRDVEFRKLTTCFLLFGFLFLVAEFFAYSRYAVFSDSPVLFYMSHAFWFAGYVPLIYACLSTLTEYSEHANERDLVLTSFVLLGLATVLLVPVSLSIVNSHSDYLKIPGIKVLAILYPYFDCIVLFSLLFLLRVYRTGKLAFYWSAVTAGILMFTVGDIASAFVLAYGLDFLSPLMSGFFILAYSFLALSLGAVGYFQWKISLMEPEGRYVVRQVFLVNRSGILIARRGRETESVDSDILSSMLTAVQDFVKDSFDGKTKTKERLRLLQYGGQEIEIEHGDHVYLAVVLDGVGTEHLHSRMRGIISKIESDYSNVFTGWKGNREVFDGAEKYFTELF
jgi:hypothetical protein